MADASDAVCMDSVFGTFASLLQHADELQGATLNKLLDTILSGKLLLLTLVAQYYHADRI